MSFLRLIGHNVWNKKLRSALTALAVALGVITVIVLGVVTYSIRTTAAGVLKVGTADLTVAQQGVSDILNSSLSGSQLQAVQKLPHVKSAIGVLLNTEKLDQDHPLVIEVGIRPEDLAPFGVQIAAGKAFGATADDEVMLGIRLAQDLGLEPGDTLDIEGGKKKIVGVFNTGSSFGDATVMFPLVPFQAAERQPDGLSLFFIHKTPGATTGELKKEVEASSPLLVGISSLIDFGRADRSFQLISAVDRAATIVAIGVGAIVVMNAMLLSLVERYREFGVLRAIGWSRLRLFAMIFGEAGLIALLGAAVGVGIAFAAVAILSRLPELSGFLKPTYQSWVFGRALITAIAVTALGALYPAVRAARLSPQEAMRRE